MSEQKTDYRPMWSDLGLDLEKHDALLSVLGQAYSDTFLSQSERPEGMGYFDFVMSEVHGLRIKELVNARADGAVVVGSFCVFVPEEIIVALGGISVGLCAGAEFGFDAAEKYLPVNTCSLIKSAFGFTLEKVCPYIAASDLVVGENTCDGKKKGYEILGDLLKKVYVMDLPQTKSESGRTLLLAEYQKFAGELEKRAGKKLDADSLKTAIDKVNAKRKAVARIADLRKADPVPISGLDSLLINQVFFYDDLDRFTASVNKIADELQQRVEKGEGVVSKGTPRIVLSGCPMAVPNWKIPSIVESCGAVIVGEESCIGERGSRHLTDNSGSTVDQLLQNIADRYLQIDCAVFTPNPGRTEHVKEMVDKYRADGVINYNLQFCSPYQFESGPAEKTLKEDGVPVLRLDTDYSAGDVEQLRTRIEAFIERIKG